jgi:hypothetical protein
MSVEAVPIWNSPYVLPSISEAIGGRKVKSDEINCTFILDKKAFPSEELIFIGLEYVPAVKLITLKLLMTTSNSLELKDYVATWL